ncbi:hypothetical protein SAMN02799624_00547 [Paenibacillus sp. UNC496MF]|uniref:hypothetical protein n=1 Tax=Paenibacillus sp. UNC496MF TaxID=1502753 RepID=UPI0008E3A572|nr:hypothetical protein [Paenibacillus sp. UNC496MF]SFI35471.1 hypothetical protein SAMN02799624_00547 [Paenibacillus sp. UNC496MF]
MHGPGYILLWLVLLLVLLAAGWRRRWWPFAAYAAGCVVFFVEVNRGNGGWDDLADFATFLVFVVPLYLIGTAAWLIMLLAERRRRTRR